MKQQIIIIGGGAAGLTAGILLGRAGKQVTILEKNPTCGKKLLACGNGRCNLTNLQMGPEKYHSPQRDKVWEVLQTCPPDRIRDFFYALGIPTIDLQGWVYPACRQGAAVLKSLRAAAEAAGVRIKTNEEVISIRKTEQHGYRVLTAGWKYDGDLVITACGCPASEISGASDTVLQLAKELHLEAVPFTPALTSLGLKGIKCPDWAGTRVQGKVTLLLDGNPVRSETGELQLTEHGISGIPVFQLSGQALLGLQEHCTAELLMDFLPDMTEQDLHAYMEQTGARCPYKSDADILYGLLPDRLLKVVAPKGASRQQIVRSCKSLRLSIREHRSLRQAQVCAGGISPDALTPHLESRQYAGLFFAGDAVNVYGDCGGYNLHWAWSSAFCIAEEILGRKES